MAVNRSVFYECQTLEGGLGVASGSDSDDESSVATSLGVPPTTVLGPTVRPSRSLSLSPRLAF